VENYDLLQVLGLIVCGVARQVLSLEEQVKGMVPLKKAIEQYKDKVSDRATACPS
jgi:hypothetical protein